VDKKKGSYCYSAIDPKDNQSSSLHCSGGVFPNDKKCGLKQKDDVCKSYDFSISAGKNKTCHVQADHLSFECAEDK